MASNYLLLITLEGTEDPEIHRLLSIPKTLTFHDLHRAIQVSFGWAGCHMYQFTVTDPVDEEATGLQRRQRHLRLERDPSLGIPSKTPTVAAASMKLSEVFEGDKYKDKEVEYEYDFGDGWSHYIEFVGWGKDDTEGRVVCFSGQGHGAAEDAGGVSGWQDVVDAYKSKRASKEQKELRRWYEKECSNRDPKGLSGPGGAWEWSRDKVNWDLQQLKF